MSDIKRKVFHILEILHDTDEDHPLTAAQISEKLDKKFNIKAERKSICRDINMFKDDLGYDIILSSDNKQGYFMGSRKFEDWELKILIDAVSTARFLSNKDAFSLIEKLKKESSKAGQAILGKTKPVKSTIRAKTNQVRYYIDGLMKAIRSNRKVQFKYIDLDKNLNEKFRNDGRIYVVNPYLLYWEDDRYYLIGNYDKYDDLSNYRLDRIRELNVCEDQAKSIKEILGDKPDLALEEYINKSIYRYGGKEIELHLFCVDGIQADIIDHFGKGVKVKPVAGGFEAVIKTLESEGLIYWLMQYGKFVRVLSPESVRKDFLDFLQGTMEMNK